MNAYLFPGQGSQAKGMGKDLFGRYKELVDQSNTILGYSIEDLCLNDPRKELNRTEFTQPAVYVVNALSYFKKIEDTGTKPDYAAGHSLGEYNALLISECFDFSTGLQLVKKRGELMSQATDGAMAAVLNTSEEQIKEILSENKLTDIDIANYNAPTQIVLSGSRDHIRQAEEFFTHDNMQYIPLNTSGAFHSRYMTESKSEFSEFLKDFDFSPLQIPVIANVTARPYRDEDVVSNLANQITGSVKWTDSIRYLMGIGKKRSNGISSEEMCFEEMGNGDILTKLVQSIKTNDESNYKKHEEKVISSEEKVRVWNEKHPVGTKVKSVILDGKVAETRTEAMLLFQHRAAVYLEGYKGYFDLDEIVPA